MSDEFNFDFDFEYELTDENDLAIKEAISELISNSSAPDAYMIDYSVFKKASNFKNWIESEFETEVQTRIEKFGFYTVLNLMFVTDMISTNVEKQIEFINLLSDVDSMGIWPRDDGLLGVSFSYSEPIKYYSKN